MLSSPFSPALSQPPPSSRPRLPSSSCRSAGGYKGSHVGQYWGVPGNIGPSLSLVLILQPQLQTLQGQGAESQGETGLRGRRWVL